MRDFLNRHEEYEDLEKQLKVLNDRLRSWRKEMIITTNPDKRIEARERIKDLKSQREELEIELLKLEEVSTTAEILYKNEEVVISVSERCQLLYDSMQKLNYRKQVLLFRRFLQAHSEGAFLIQGPPYFGQRWLLNRLVRIISLNSTKPNVAQVNLDRQGRSNSLNAIQYELNKSLKLNGNASTEEAIKAICDWRRTKDVILVFHGIDRIPEEFLKTLIDELWLTLINFNDKVDVRVETSTKNTHHKLIMFLINYSYKTIENKTLFSERYDSSWEPNIPLKLPNLCHFFVDELNLWMNNEIDVFPIELIQDINHTIHRQILNGNDKGVPLEILEKICNLCDCSLFELEEMCI